MNMILAANESIKGQNAQIEQAYMEDWSYPADTYDLVISRLAIHYIEDVDSLFRKVYHTLKENGTFIFSVEHPVITSTLQPSGVRTNWVVDQYFVEGFREQQWLGGTVKKCIAPSKPITWHCKRQDFKYSICGSRRLSVSIL